ncbi:hypothetical protein A3I53_01735 [Candidatus Curtissbacteria bacterium RIFCSPLOWO2_02_FULL_40_13b]|nr:MAG: hypothetical protein A2693_04920 [Candidatus Curtissbacteria bacterium RIFCSPHIGHO2_01_FULL_40_12]OGE08844.1 MAG: hypothetical protein A3I53_01735 [Candidatus Curtissbacteria bacterium RIFCSPLOWO2_02_FULL_40_13b]
MRDLANQNFSTNKKSPIPRSFRLIILAVIIAVAVFFIGSRVNLPVGGGQDIVLQESPRNLSPVSVDDSESVTEGGVDLVTQTAALKDVKYGGDASGRASRSFGGGTYILSVDATLPDPKNTNYQVWLTDGTNVIPIDYMRGSKTSWSLSLRDTDKYSKYDGIWVTLERSKDNKPEERVLEGSF